MFEPVRRLFQRSPASGNVQAHITFGATSVGRTFSRTGLLLKKQLWIWPIIAVVLLAIVGVSIRVAIERTMQASLQSELETLLNVEKAMVVKWMKIQEASAVTLANDPQVRRIVTDLLAAAPHSSVQAASAAAANPPASAPQTTAATDLEIRLAKELEPAMSSHGFVGFAVADKSQRIIAAHTQSVVGTTVAQYSSFFARALEGTPTVSVPFPSVVMLKDSSGRVISGVPTMFVAAPIRDENLQVVAALAMRIRPEAEFTNILQLGRTGVTGETYAFDKTGLLVSNSRFDDQLILLGLLPDTQDARSILNISLRDPGGDMTAGYRPQVRRAKMPLVGPVAAAIGGTSGVDVSGYRGYRGTRKVGAWAWLPQYEMGIITDIDHSEAYRPLSILRWTFFSIFGLLIASSLAIFGFTLMLARAQREAQKAAIEAKHLGQYRLEEKLGAGAMGVVYKGCHAMLRRPTAIKMLNLDKVNEASIQRFEREVQITCKLNNPSTVAIYDYGRTPEGVFYYAMEFLDGIDLQQLVDRYGPQSEGRVIRILKSVCGSLYEAHSLGLVHRDIKPANIMLNRRGGEPDVVKVLDFGLVKALDESQQQRRSGGIVGTPLYMSPEAIQTPDLVDHRSDIYAVGAVGYFLLTGQPVFQAATIVDLCQQHAAAVPDTPSQRLGRAVTSELESALLACLEKSRAKRPQTARDLTALLERAPTAGSWTLDDAEAWWGRHERSKSSAGGRAGAIASARAATPGGTVVEAGNGHADNSSAEANHAGRTAAPGFDQTIASG